MDSPPSPLLRRGVALALVALAVLPPFTHAQIPLEFHLGSNLTRYTNAFWEIDTAMKSVRCEQICSKARIMSITLAELGLNLTARHSKVQWAARITRKIVNVSSQHCKEDSSVLQFRAGYIAS